MGKNKDTGRSKTRPSSSSLAASLLPHGASNVGFGGYLGSSKVEAASTENETADTSFSAVDAELAQHLKRLGRKDPTTKLKALTTLHALFREKNHEDIVHILPHWAFEYKRLLNDYSKEVRRATHETMASLVITIGRGLAPHLKALIGPWWFSQFDQVPEISQAARRSFEAAFPAQEKRLDALIISSSEIFIYLDENLKLTPQAMSNKAAPIDELEDMHLHVLSSSLLAIATLVDILVVKPQVRSEVVTTELKILSKARADCLVCAEKMFHTHKCFLEYFKSKYSRVRSAAYSVLGSFIKNVPLVVNEKNIKMLSAAILGSFEENDASCHSSMWDMILLFSQRFQGCWSQGNIQKNSLVRLWKFLQNECYGSQQISYPVLVLLLDSLPDKIVIQDRFIMNFFQNMWAGRNPFQSQPTNRQVYFRTMKECFLWSIFKASRYVPVEDMHRFQASVIDNVLLKLMWCDYFSSININDQNGDSSGKLKSDYLTEDYISSASARSNKSLHNPISYLHDLGKCIIEILSEISSNDGTMLKDICSAIQRDWLDTFQQPEHLPRFSGHVEQITRFFLLLGEFVEEDQNWPLFYLGGPFIAKSLPLIKSLDSVDAVRLLCTMVEIFGSQIIILHQFLVNNEDQYCDGFIEKCKRESSINIYLQVFKDEFIPWCLDDVGHSSSLKLDLLISLFDDRFFSEQWHSVIKYATKPLESSGKETSAPDAGNICLLAMLLEKVRKKRGSKRIQTDLDDQNGLSLEHWQHVSLDMFATTVAHHSSSIGSFHAQLIRAAIGGSSEDDQVCFLSKEALVSIFEAVLRNLAKLLAISSFSWATAVSSLLMSIVRHSLNQKSDLSKVQMLEMAQFSIEVLDGTIFCLKRLVEDCKLLSYILAAVFFIEWDRSLTEEILADIEHTIIANRSAPVLGDVVGVDAHMQIVDRSSLSEKVRAFQKKLGVKFWGGLDPLPRQILRNMLVQTARSVVIEINDFSTDRLPTLCCDCVLDALSLICLDPAEEQSALDQLLSENEYWPMWIFPDVSTRTRSTASTSKHADVDNHEQRRRQFVAFVDKLISNLGVRKVIVGFVPESYDATSLPVDSRSWVAAEVLCTWEWQGGCALESLLPLLCEYAKCTPSTTKENLLFYVIDALIDGAIIHGASKPISFNVWATSDEEVHSIQDPYLRAVTSLLFSLIVSDSIWQQSEASYLFGHVVDKLFVGTTVNHSCLRVLPFVLNIISQPLLCTDSMSFEGGEVQFDSSNISSVCSNRICWLQTALTLPPLASEQGENQDAVEWIQLIVSCYPLTATGVVGSIRISELSSISQLEKTLILKLFRKQRYHDNALTSRNQLSPFIFPELGVVSSVTVQMMVNLTAVSVGYCWKEFDDDDWEFVFVQLQKWLGTSVILIEEIAEKVDDVVMNSAAHEDAFVAKLKLAVQDLGTSQLNISRTVLIILSFFTKLFSSKELEDERVLAPVLEKWAYNNDQILEDVFRLFLAIGAVEAIAKSFSKEASFIIAASQRAHCNFWVLVSSCVINSPVHIRSSAMNSMNLWGLSVGPIASLYALIFSCEPSSPLQLAAYNVLSTEPVCRISVLEEDENARDRESETSFEHSIRLRDEISSIVEKPYLELSKCDLLSNDRVNYLIGWALMLSYLHSLPYSTPAKERFVQHVQDSVSPTVLDCIFQHIPLKKGSFHNLKKKDTELPIEVSKAANSAKHAITESSLSFAVESLWPVGEEQIAVLAGSIYGSLIHLLPAYVRNWFTGLRDRSLISAIESFTKVWCSPPLIADEFSQMKGVDVADENFSVTINKSAYEIIATYKKEETGMDLVIHLPSCYPLRPVDVDCSRSLGISEVKQRKWLLSLTAFVRNQNGAIAEAVRNWKRNIDKEFLGVEECPICYSIIHTANRSLPQLACKTCKHRFHSACLYKWFSTSNKSTCPLCQMPF